MKRIIKLRWFLLVLWLFVTVILTITKPDIKAIINEKGDKHIKSSEPSQVAKKVLDKMENTKGEVGIIVFNKKAGLSKDDMKDIEKSYLRLKQHKKELGITKILSHFDVPEIKENLVSKNNTTVMIPIKVEKNKRETSKILKELKAEIEPNKVDYYVTGSLFISNDFLKVTFAGVNKSAIITVVFILVVLALIFRSVMTPVVSLGLVGISYFLSMGIVSQLIDKFKFPVTSLTEMFIILILFGIGTDYNILLFNRFKEEMKKHDSIDEAIIETYRTAGKTIFYSCLTVFIAFSSLYFAQFGVYKSACCVAIAILVLLLEIFTLTPLALKRFGPKLFWPSKNSKGHKDSKLWKYATSFAVKYPILNIVIAVLIFTPVILLYTQNLSFDNLKDMSDKEQSVKGFNLIKKNFGTGKALETTVVIKNKKPLDNNEALAVIDSLTYKIASINGVEDVLGPTQPKGEMIKNFYISNQTKKVADGVDKSSDGVSKIKDGILEANNKITTPDFSKVDDLLKGTGTVQTSLVKLNTAIDQVYIGISQGAGGAGEIKKGITEIKDKVKPAVDGLPKIYNGYYQLYINYDKYNGEIKKVINNPITDGNDLTKTQKSLSKESGVGYLLDKLLEKNPDLINDKDFTDAKAKVNTANVELTSDIGKLTLYTSIIDKLNKNSLQQPGLKDLNDILEPIANGQTNLITGLSAAEKGLEGLSTGLNQGSNGQKLISTNLKLVTKGMDKVKSGQKQMNDGLITLGAGMGTLKDGLGKSGDGLNTINSGLNEANKYIKGLNGVQTFYIPKEALNDKSFKKSLDEYMSKDRKTVKISVNLNSDPYSKDAINDVKNIDKFVKNQVKGGYLKDATIGIAGETATTKDLKNVSVNDIASTQIIVLVGVFIVLIFVIKSVLIPAYITASLVVAYYTSMTLTEFITRIVLNRSELSWNVPFFSFVMIVALGVDYSIFLMMRYKEYSDLSPKYAIVEAAKNVGGVVLSAAIILAGTFATLYPSGIHTLMELAISVGTGLMTLSLILLPLVIPSLIALPERFTKKPEVNKFTQIY